jgi:hypothetical protein
MTIFLFVQAQCSEIMQLDDSSIHKLFAIKTLRHTKTSSIKTIIFYIMKTSHNLNHAMYAMHANVLLINC